MHSIEFLRESAPLIENRIGYHFNNLSFLLLAFVHRSYYNEHREAVKGHNERLEFLGDSVLGLIVSDYLFAKLPLESEGHLSHLRAHLIGAGSCMEFMRSLDLESFLLLGRGEMENIGRGRERILANLFEALIGAVYLDGGLIAAQKFFLQHFSQNIDKVLENPLHNWKAEFQDYAQKKTQKPPEYRVLEEIGPPHSKIFIVAVFIDKEEMGRGEGASKKIAEQAAAEDALRKLEKEDHE